MKRTQKIILALNLIFQISLFAQDTITINFDSEYHLTNDKRNGFMMLIDNHDTNVYYDGQAYKITFPSHFFVTDTAVAFNYFTGWQKPKIKNVSSFLIGNYTSKNPIMYVDYNHNLDFSDDGLPLKFKKDSTSIVYLPNSKLTSASFPIKFFYPELKPKSKKQIESIFTSTGPIIEGNNIVSIDYWIADKRMSCKVSNSWLNGRSIKIGLYDYDCNGLYNDERSSRFF